MDPYNFRLQNMRDGRRSVRAASGRATRACSGRPCEASGYEPHVSGSQLQSGNVVTGWGMAIGTHNASYAATVAHVEVDKKTGKITRQAPLVAARTPGFVDQPGPDR